MSPRVRRRRWPNGQRGRECGGARGQTLSSMLGSPQVHQGGYRPPLCVVLAEEGSDPAGMRKGEEARSRHGWNLPAPSLSTAAPKAGEVGRVMLDQDPNRDLPGSPKRGVRSELSPLQCGLRATLEMCSAQHDEKDPNP